MQKKLYFLFIIPLFFGCSNSHNVETYTSENEVIVTAENNSQDCHMCPGYLLIERGNTIDTVKRGGWGKPPSFNQFKANDRDYEQIDHFRINRRGLEFRAPDTLLVHQHNEISNSNDESSKRADSLSKLHIIEKTSFFSGAND